MAAPDPQQCRLLAGPAALGAQLVLGLLAVSSLLYKRHIERPQRPMNVWGLDVSKQAVSMLAAHVCGMLIALIAHHTVTANSSECAWYFVAFSFDTTVGLLLTVLLHKAALRCARWYGTWAAEQSGQADALEVPGGDEAGERWYLVLQACGNYGNPPSYRRWAIQLAEWVACVVLARAMCGTLVVLLGTLLAHVARGLDSLFAGHPTLLLYFVMIACPLGMNLCQVLVQDLVLKFNKRGQGSGVAADETSLAKLSGPPAVEQEASLLGPAAQRSA